MTVDIEHVKRRNPIEDVISEKHKLTGSGRYRHLEGDHSLVIDTERGCYFQNGGGDEGWGQDVIAWVQHRERCDFKEAVEWLCRRARLPQPEWNNGDGLARQSARLREDAFTVAARIYVKRLRECQAAFEYAHKARGWTEETIRKAGLGYTGSGTANDRTAMIESFRANNIDPESPAAVSIIGYTGNVAEWAKRWNVKPQMNWLDRNHIEGFPAKMLVYPHVRGGRVRYLSGRLASTEPKKELEQQGIRTHHNLNEALAGERQRYFNHAYSPKADLAAIQEGQADSVTLAQWGIAAIALAGNAADEMFVKELKGCHKRIVVWLDNEPAMWPKAVKVANQFGPMTRLVRQPA